MKRGDFVLLRDQKFVRPPHDASGALITAFDAWGNPKLLGFGFHKFFHKNQCKVVSSETR